MKKIPLLLIICLILASVFISACEIRTTESMVKAKRRLEKYLPKEETTQQNSAGVIDLSDGPKLNYDKKLGPNDLNFDIKIVDPY